MEDLDERPWGVVEHVKWLAEERPPGDVVWQNMPDRAERFWIDVECQVEVSVAARKASLYLEAYPMSFPYQTDILAPERSSSQHLRCLFHPPSGQWLGWAQDLRKSD